MGFSLLYSGHSSSSSDGFLLAEQKKKIDAKMKNEKINENKFFLM